MSRNKLSERNMVLPKAMRDFFLFSKRIITDDIALRELLIYNWNPEALILIFNYLMLRISIF